MGNHWAMVLGIPSYQSMRRAAFDHAAGRSADLPACVKKGTVLSRQSQLVYLGGLSMSPEFLALHPGCEPIYHRFPTLAILSCIQMINFYNYKLRPRRSLVARSQACISAADRICIASIVADIRTRSLPEMQSCAANCLRPAPRPAAPSAAIWCSPACRTSPEYTLRAPRPPHCWATHSSDD